MVPVCLGVFFPILSAIGYVLLLPLQPTVSALICMESLNDSSNRTYRVIPVILIFEVFPASSWKLGI